MAMRGDDILAIRADPVLAVRFLKGEVKSRAALAAKSVADARDALSSNHGRPTPHALAFLSDRLSETGHKALSDLIDDQLRQRIKKAQISHLLFVFTGTDPRRALAADLAAYTDTIPQHAVGLRVLAHQDFVKQIFDRADRDALDP